MLQRISIVVLACATALLVAGRGLTVSAQKQTIPEGVSIETSDGRFLLAEYSELAPHKNGDVHVLRRARVVKDVKRFFVNLTNWDPLAIRFAVGERVYTELYPPSTLLLMKVSPRGMFIKEARSADLNPKWYQQQYRKLARERGEPAFLILRIASAVGLDPREYPVRLDPIVLDQPAS